MHVMKACGWEEVWSHWFLTSLLDESDGQLDALETLYPRESVPIAHCSENGLGSFGQEKILLPLPGID
jgi:hypothetical protein